MRIAIIQPYFFPYIGYMQLMQSVDVFYLLDDVHYIVRGWVNRNRVRVGEQAHWLTVPLVKPSPNKLICELLLQPDDVWRRKMLRTLETSYAKAPYFESVYAMISKVLEASYEKLAPFLHHTLQILTEYLGIEKKMLKTSEQFPGLEEKGQDRIITICQQAGAAVYINPPGGKELYEPEAFQEAGIELRFLKTSWDRLGPTTFSKERLSYSIIDLMMHHSPEQIKEWLACYELQ